MFLNTPTISKDIQVNDVLTQDINKASVFEDSHTTDSFESGEYKTNKDKLHNADNMPNSDILFTLKPDHRGMKSIYSANWHLSDNKITQIVPKEGFECVFHIEKTYAERILSATQPAIMAITLGHAIQNLCNSNLGQTALNMQSRQVLESIVDQKVECLMGKGIILTQLNEIYERYDIATGENQFNLAKSDLNSDLLEFINIQAIKWWTDAIIQLKTYKFKTILQMSKLGRSSFKSSIGRNEKLTQWIFEFIRSIELSPTIVPQGTHKNTASVKTFLNSCTRII